MQSEIANPSTMSMPPHTAALVPGPVDRRVFRTLRTAIGRRLPPGWHRRCFRFSSDLFAAPRYWDTTATHNLIFCLYFFKKVAGRLGRGRGQSVGDRPQDNRVGQHAGAGTVLVVR